jgi:hypothetical protein
VSNKREIDALARRLLLRVGIVPRRPEKTPDWIGSVDGPADLSENFEAYKREASESAEADAYGITVDELRAKRRREGLEGRGKAR